MTSPRNLWIRCDDVCVLVVSERLYQTILRLNYNSSWLDSYDTNVRERKQRLEASESRRHVTFYVRDVFEKSQLHAGKVAEEIGWRFIATFCSSLIQVMSEIAARNSNVVPYNIFLVWSKSKWQTILYESVVCEIRRERTFIVLSARVLGKRHIQSGSFCPFERTDTVSSLFEDILLFFEPL